MRGELCQVHNPGLMHNLRCRISDLLRRGYKKYSKSYKLLGCTIEELKIYLEKQFQPGMTWENYGKNGWEIDHILPCDSFDFNKIEDQQKCFNWKNLQPLWMKDNRKKKLKNY